MTKTDFTQEVAHTMTKGVPPITVAGLTFAGVQLQDWVYILTLIWLVVQIFVTTFRFVAERKRAGKK